MSFVPRGTVSVLFRVFIYLYGVWSGVMFFDISNIKVKHQFKKFSYTSVSILLQTTALVRHGSNYAPSLGRVSFVLSTLSELSYSETTFIQRDEYFVRWRYI